MIASLSLLYWFLGIAAGCLFAILKAEVMAAVGSLALLVLVSAWFTCAAAAEEWSRARIARLSDSAFAVVETTPDGRKLRHLPHHDETGAVDLAHLKAARSRVGQVKWVDPANAEVARRHLEEHWRQLRDD
ncbi:MAG: hypothetical protein HY726_10660 [Candidatus Rokubacteria bacterium]|nr:hypothetical protein [Candidatus Rokubacteria bacterium]